MRWMIMSGWLAVSLMTSSVLAGEGETPPVPIKEETPLVNDLPKDIRLTVRTLNDGYHPWVPPETKEAWETEQKQIRERILVSQGLWPQPPKTPLEPVIHSPIDKGDYIIEKVYFASYPGHYVCGNLYRPKTVDGKVPGVLCPHGHWPNGRFYDAGDEGAKAQIEQKAEEFPSGAHSPLQARMVQLARMGCIVFHYDMVGYADSTQIGHREGFTDPTADLWLQNFMGLQTWNSIRALDFLLSLENVDPDRIGVTGASGGGTQTFMLGAIDDRVTVGFPAVMVSTAMQGGCICENAPYLRIGLNNVSLAAAFAPKPMAMSGADDWTIDIETKGLPELRQVYGFYGQQDLVAATCWPQFKHNYNQVAREFMYEWFNAHLKLGHKSPIKEREFEVIPAQELRVFDDQHPRPDDAIDAAGLKQYLTKVSQEQFQSLLPKKPDDLQTYQKTIGIAARVMLDEGVPDPALVESVGTPIIEGRANEDWTVIRGYVTRQGAGEAVPYVILHPRDFTDGKTVLWLDGKGSSHLLDEQGKPTPAARKLLDAKYAVASIDVFAAGEKPESLPAVDQNYSGYTFCYNRPLLSNRVRDILTGIGLLKNLSAQSVTLVGTGEAGPWVALAGALAGENVEHTIADLRGFSFGKITSTQDPMSLPGALKYGDIGGLLALTVPRKIAVFGTKDIPEEALKPLFTMYRAGRVSEKLRLNEDELKADDVPGIVMGR